MKAILQDIDTPALVINKQILLDNLRWMQEKADNSHVRLRPHIKTHKTPFIAGLQLSFGACGIAAAKISEAEIMADHGIRDIFIANVTYGDAKLARLRRLSRKTKLRIGVDCMEQVNALNQIFACEEKPISISLEIDVGEKRTGLSDDKAIRDLGLHIRNCKHVLLDGVFSHEGHSYNSTSHEELLTIAQQGYHQTIHAADILRQIGFSIEHVSVGSTPTLLFSPIPDGITEIRPGTYALMDAAQGTLLQDYSHCAASILATVISKHHPDRIVLDAGAKALTMQQRPCGLCKTPGYGMLLGAEHIRLTRLYDEHGIINDKVLYDSVSIGDKLNIIPNHICPCVNLYKKLYLYDADGYQVFDVACQSQTQ